MLFLAKEAVLFSLASILTDFPSVAVFDELKLQEESHTISSKCSFWSSLNQSLPAMVMFLLTFLVQEKLKCIKRLDKVDRICLGIIKLSLLVICITFPMIMAEEQGGPPSDFFFLCSGGKHSELKTLLEDHPSWANARTENGETCLHLAGIQGFPKVTELLLQHGANPNARSTYDQGLRMHPISWNTYGGHYENIKLLLAAGADVNADFDSMDGRGPITALDLVIQLKKVEEGDDRFVQLESLLHKYDALTYKEIQNGAGQEL